MPKDPKEIVKELAKRPENRKCADCDAREPCWASTNLGITICEICAGIHRALGTHISKVKSVRIDVWKPEMVEVLKAIGNAKSNAYYEYNVPDGAKYKSNITASQGDKIDTAEGKKLEAWIRSKYEQKKYAPKGVDEPHVRVARGESLDDPGGGAGSTPTNERRSSRHKEHKEQKEHKEHKDKGKDREEGRKDSRERKSKKSHRDRDHDDGHHHHHHHRDHDDGHYDGGHSSHMSDFAAGFAAESFKTVLDYAADVGEGMKQKKEKKSKKDRDDSTRGRRKSSHDEQQYHHQASNFDPSVAGPGLPFDGYNDRMPPHGQMGHMSQQQFDGYNDGMPPQDQMGYMPQQQQMEMDQMAHVSQHASTPQLHQAQMTMEGMMTPAMERTPQTLHMSPGTAPQPQVSVLAGGSSVRDAARQYEQAISATGQGCTGMSHPGVVPPTPASLMVPSIQAYPPDGTASSERRAALLTIARLFRTPETVGVSRSTPLIRPFGFDLHTAEFEKEALKRQRDPNEVAALQAAAREAKAREAAAAREAKAARDAAAAAAAAHEAMKREAAAQAQAAAVEAAKAARAVAIPERHEAPEWFEEGGPTSPIAKNVDEKQMLAQELRAAVGEVVGDMHEELRRIREEVGTLKREQAYGSLYSTQHTQPTPPQHENMHGWAHVQPYERKRSSTSVDFDAGYGCPHLASGRPGWSSEVSAGAGRYTPQVTGSYTPQHTGGSRTGPLANEQCAYSPGIIAYNGGREGDASRATSPTRSELNMRGMRHDDVQWTMDRATFGDYVRNFHQADKNGNGFVDGPEVRELFDQSGLPPLDLGLIFRIVGGEEAGGRLNLEAFVCAMHLVNKRLAGIEVPVSLPLELSRCVTDLYEEYAGPLRDIQTGGRCPHSELLQGHLSPDVRQTEASFGPAASPWAVEQGQLEQYLRTFEGTFKRGGPHVLHADEARDLLGSSGLPIQDLAQIWKLADVDCDDCLVLNEFIYAMHMATLRRHGFDLPLELPAELVASVESANVGGVFGSTPRPSSEIGKAYQPPEVAKLQEENAALQEELKKLKANSTNTDTAPQIGGAEKTPWDISPDLFARYMVVFEDIDLTDGQCVSADEAMKVLERSNLKTAEILSIWRLSDIDGDGRLNHIEFACALHLASLCRQGTIAEMPTTLPAELMASLTALHRTQPVRPSPPAAKPRISNDRVETERAVRPSSASPWDVNEEHLSQYRHIFELNARENPNFLSAVEVKEILDRSLLEEEILRSIWRMSDIDADNQLSFNEFVCAMHLTARCKQGHELPRALPQEILASLGAQAQQMPSTASSWTGNSARVQAMPSPASSWSVTGTQLEKYRDLFQAHAQHNSEYLVTDEMKDLLQRSELPTEELAHVWKLSDWDRDNRFSLPEFICAMHMAALRRHGLDLPDTLPQELLASVGNAGVPDQGASGHSNDSRNVSPWSVEPDELENYWMMFRESARRDPRVLGPDEAKDLLMRSQLPQAELQQIWKLSDQDEDSQLSFPEFVCAMHMAQKRAQGFPLLAAVPLELDQFCRALASEQQPSSSVPSVGMENPWLVSQDELRAYQGLFQELPGASQTGKVSFADVRDLFDNSGLPPEDLSFIWNLADADGDTFLTWAEFVSAIHLLSRRRKHVPLPDALPPELSNATGGHAGF